MDIMLVRKSYDCVLQTAFMLDSTQSSLFPQPAEDSVCLCLRKYQISTLVPAAAFSEAAFCTFSASASAASLLPPLSLLLGGQSKELVLR